MEPLDWFQFMIFILFLFFCRVTGIFCSFFFFVFTLSICRVITNCYNYNCFSLRAIASFISLRHTIRFWWASTSSEIVRCHIPEHHPIIERRQETACSEQWTAALLLCSPTSLFMSGVMRSEVFAKGGNEIQSGKSNGHQVQTDMRFTRKIERSK